MTLIVTFLAVLEVVRLGLVKIYQEKDFGIIWVMNPGKAGAQTSGEQEEASETVLS